MATASELEEQLHELIGKFPGFGNRDDNIKTFDDIMRANLRTKNRDMEMGEFNHLYTKSVETATSLIKQWMIAKELDPNIALKSTSLVVQNAYKGGDAYLNKMRDNAANERNQKRFGTGGGRGRPVDIDIDLLNTPGIGNNPMPMTPATISATDIRKAVETVAFPELTRMRNDIRTDMANSLSSLTNDVTAMVDSVIAEEVSKLELGQQMTDEIRRIAEIAARQMAETMLPRRVEVIKDGKPIQLDHEPRHEKFERILKWLLARKHVYLVGPRGTGKTHLGNQLRDALRIALDRNDYEAYFIDQSLTKYDIKGFKSPIGEYVGTMVRDCVEKGGLLFIDEGDTWAAAALNSMNSILANNVGAFPDKAVVVHPDFRCVLAANTYGQGADGLYVGRNPLDFASRDRFKFVTMDYDRKMEAQLYGTGPWTQYVWRVRDACVQLKKPEMLPSMRAIDDCHAGTAVGLTPDEIVEDALWKGAGQDVIDMIKSHAGEPPRRQAPMREVA